MARLITEKAFSQWGQRLKEKTGIQDESKLKWLSEYCYNHMNEENKNRLNEGLNFATTSTLGGITGMGPVTLPGSPGTPSDFYNRSTKGSGDKFPSLLPMAIQIATKTVGFDIVPVIPMSGPSGILAYTDYVYASKSENTDKQVLSIKLSVGNIASTKYTLGGVYWAVNTMGAYDTDTKAVKLTFMGYSFINGDALFRIGKSYKWSGSAWVEDLTILLKDVFTGEQTLDGSGDVTESPILVLTDDGTIPAESGGVSEDSYITVAVKPELVKAVEDHISGPAGAGNYDEDVWHNTNDGTTIVEPMSRGTGERTYYRTLNLTTYTKSIEAKTYKIAAEITTEQLQDLNRQWGQDPLAMLENALIEEISQNINKHILQRAFALGWTSNADIYKSQNVTLNMTTIPKASAGTATFLNKLNFPTSIVIPAWAEYGGFENQSTVERRVASAILKAGNMVTLRSRGRRPNLVVCNGLIASAIQNIANFSFAPFNNTISQESGSLHPVGTIFGNMTVYVDPGMDWTDTRVLVGRKGGEDEPGLKFMPYIMAEPISAIAEGTMSPKIAVISRYALAEAGHHPESVYYTLYIDVAEHGL